MLSKNFLWISRSQMAQRRRPNKNVNPVKNVDHIFIPQAMMTLPKDTWIIFTQVEEHKWAAYWASCPLVTVSPASWELVMDQGAILVNSLSLLGEAGVENSAQTDVPTEAVGECDADTASISLSLWQVQPIHPTTSGLSRALQPLISASLQFLGGSIEWQGTEPWNTVGSWKY